MFPRQWIHFRGHYIPLSLLKYFEVTGNVKERLAFTPCLCTCGVIEPTVLLQGCIRSRAKQTGRNLGWAHHTWKPSPGRGHQLQSEQTMPEQDMTHPCWNLKNCQSLNHVRLFATSWTVVLQVLLSMGFPRQEYWSGSPFPSPGDLPNPGIKPRSPPL